MRHLHLLAGCLLAAACSTANESELTNAASLNTGPDAYHDLTELNYVTVRLYDFDPAAVSRLECALNGLARPCVDFQRLTSGTQQSDEFYLVAPLFGDNTFEIRKQSGAPLAVTHFVVCRRTMDIDFSLGLDGEVQTADDQIERTHTRGWKNGRLDWEAFSSSLTSIAETWTHLSEKPGIDTVDAVDSNGQPLWREIRRSSPLGPPGSSATYSPSGEMVAHTTACPSGVSNPFGLSEPYLYEDGGCQAYAPTFISRYGNPGTDMTWRTSDDHVLMVTEHFSKLGADWHRGVPWGGRRLRTRYLEPPTGYTMQEVPTWRTLASIDDEVSEPDSVRPGLLLRTLRNHREAGGETYRLIGYRKYEYQCAP